MGRKLTQRQLQRLIKEELENIKQESRLGSAAKAIGAQLSPKLGRFMMDYSRSEAFDDIEEKLAELEARIQALEATP